MQQAGGIGAILADPARARQLVGQQGAGQHVPPAARQLRDAQGGFHVIGGGHRHAQGAHPPQPQNHQPGLQAVDPRAESEQRRVGHAQDLGREGRIARNQRHQLPDLDVVARQQVQQSQYNRRKRGDPGQKSSAVLRLQFRDTLAHGILIGGWGEIETEDRKRRITAIIESDP